MARRIDVVVFECGTCHHKSTAPDAINAMAGEMETVERKKVEKDELGNVTNDNQTERDKKKADLEKKHKGNTFSFIDTGAEIITMCKRSYTTAAHDKTELSESDHIVLSCPECDSKLYEVRW